MKRMILRRFVAAAVCLAAFPGFLAAAAADAPDDPDAAAEQVIAAETPAPEPDPEGVITFENLESRILTEGLAGRIVTERLGAVSGTDFEQLQEWLRLSMNEIADAQWAAVTASSSIDNPIEAALAGALGGMAASSMQSRYDALREQFDAIKDGDAQEDAADRIRMAESYRDAAVMGGEALYIGVSSIAAARDKLQRQLDALDRALEALELGRALGQISNLTLEQRYATRAALVSGMETLDATISTYVMHLEELVGAPVTGLSVLGPLPEVTAEQLAAMEPEADLETAKAASYTLYAASLDLKDAKEDWKDAQEYSYTGHRLHFRYIQAEHVWQAAQLTYDNTVQQFERRFQVLYRQVQDDAQILAAKETALAMERRNCEVAELKFRLGSISYQELLSARDTLADAQDAVDSAKRTLFSEWNSYRWAVDYGVVNEVDYVSTGGTNA